jgi:ribosomal protein S18 acetylase RimI-like enzyme
MTGEYRVVPFGNGTAAPADDLHRLHAALLPTSPVLRYGPRFVKHFYYDVLPRDRQIFGWVGYMGDEPIGFVAATVDSAGFMSKALRHHWPRLGWLIGTSLLISPARLRAVWQDVRLMLARGHEPAPDTGEILSLGVRPGYREARFIRETGVHIAQDLMDRALTQLAASGVELIRAVVDADNRAAQISYSASGWELDRRHVQGWSIPSVQFVWRVPQ